MIINVILGVGLFCLFLVLWFIYEFFLKIYIIAYKLKKMDPTLKLYIKPFSGVGGIQKQCIEKYGDCYKFVKDLMKQNPQQLAYLTNLGNRPFLYLCCPKLIKELCLNHKNYTKFNVLKHSDNIITKGIFFVDNQDWNKQRMLISHSFNHQQLKKMIPIMTNSVEDKIKQIKNVIEASKDKIYVFQALAEGQLVIGDALVRIFLGNDGANKEVMGKSLTLAIADVGNIMFQQSRTGVNILSNLIFGSKARKINFMKKDKQLYELTSATVKQCEKILDKRIEEFDSSQENDTVKELFMQQFRYIFFHSLKHFVDITFS